MMTKMEDSLMFLKTEDVTSEDVFVLPFDSKVIILGSFMLVSKGNHKNDGFAYQGCALFWCTQKVQDFLNILS
jgi:hypothetical protein